MRAERFGRVSPCPPSQRSGRANTDPGVIADCGSHGTQYERSPIPSASPSPTDQHAVRQARESEGEIDGGNVHPVCHVK